jgi:hypothetical protein
LFSPVHKICQKNFPRGKHLRSTAETIQFKKRASQRMPCSLVRFRGSTELFQHVFDMLDKNARNLPAGRPAAAGLSPAVRFLTARFSPHTDPMMATTAQANEANVQNPPIPQAQPNTNGPNKSISQMQARTNTRHARIATGHAVSTTNR